jgi:hypothetical protein
MVCLSSVTVPTARNSITPLQLGEYFLDTLQRNYKVLKIDPDELENIDRTLIVQLGLLVEDAYREWVRSDFVETNTDTTESLLEVIVLPAIASKEHWVAFQGALLQTLGNLSNWITNPKEEPWPQPV